MNIGFCGAHSTGKSTLSVALKDWIEKELNFKATYICEITRSLQKQGYPVNKSATVETQSMIIFEQLKREREALGNFILSDRTLIDQLSYSITNDGIPKEYCKMLEEIVAITIPRFYDIIFYTPIEPHVPLEMDGVRLNDRKYQKDVDTGIQEILERLKIKFYELRGIKEHRIKIAKTIITERFKAKCGLELKGERTRDTSFQRVG